MPRFDADRLLLAVLRVLAATAAVIVVLAGPAALALYKMMSQY